MTPVTLWIDILLVYLLLACAYVVWRGRKEARKSAALVFATGGLLFAVFLCCGPGISMSAALLLSMIAMDAWSGPIVGGTVR